MTFDFITILGIGLLAFIFFILIITFFKAPDSIENGEQFALAYHRTSGIDLKAVDKKIFFYFRFWPISINGNQILPYYLAHWRRFYFIIETIYWCQLAEAKKRKKTGKFLILAFSHLLSIIFLLAGFSMILFPIIKTGTTNSSLAWIPVGVTTIIASFAIEIFPTFILKKESIPVIKKMTISEHDKNELIKLINLYWIIAIISIIYNAIRMFLKIMQKTQNND